MGEQETEESGTEGQVAEDFEEKRKWPRPYKPPKVKLRPRRKDGPAGTVGTSVLSMHGKMGSEEDEETDLRVDSCSPLDSTN